MTRPIAIINCRIATQETTIQSGIILIENGVITAVGTDRDITLPVDTRLLDAEKGIIKTDKNTYSLATGNLANLVCLSRYGDVRWRMHSGDIVFPPPTAKIFSRKNWLSYRTNAIEIVLEFLKSRPESRYIQRTYHRTGFQKHGVDLLWRFQPPNARQQSLTIRVVPTLSEHPASIFILDGSSARKLPEAGLSSTRAHWWFYHHNPDRAIYCLPTVALKTWMNIHAKEIPTTPTTVAELASSFRGRVLAVKRLRQDIARFRIIQL